MSKLQKKPSALKRGHPTLQNINFYKFFSTFVGNFCPPGSGSGSGFRIRIRIRIHWPDWIRIQSGSGYGSGSEIKGWWNDSLFSWKKTTLNLPKNLEFFSNSLCLLELNKSCYLIKPVRWKSLSSHKGLSWDIPLHTPPHPLSRFPEVERPQGYTQLPSFRLTSLLIIFASCGFTISSQGLTSVLWVPLAFRRVFLLHLVSSLPVVSVLWVPLAFRRVSFYT